MQTMQFPAQPVQAAKSSKRRSCRTIDLKEMFFSLAHSVRLKGRDAFFWPTDNGMTYQFRLGDNVCTYSFRKETAVC